MMFRRAVVVLVVAGAGLFVGARPAGAFPVGEVPHVSCDKIEIDPPTWLQVRFTGTIGGKSFDRTAVYDNTPGIYASVPIADLTTGTGPLPFTVHADGGYLGTADSEGTITCHEAPTTTVSSTTSVSSTSTTIAKSPTSIQKTSSTTVCTEPRGCCLAQCEGPTVAAEELPHTGSSTVPFGAVGTGAVGVGAALLALARRRRTT